MKSSTTVLVALNGDQVHPGAPREPVDIAKAAQAAIRAGASAIHVHAFDRAGRETLDGWACGEVPRSIRVRCPDTPISLTTSATIVPDPAERLRVVSAWEELPELVTAAVQLARASPVAQDARVRFNCQTPRPPLRRPT